MMVLLTRGTWHESAFEAGGWGPGSMGRNPKQSQPPPGHPFTPQRLTEESSKDPGPCYALNCVSPKYTCASPEPQCNCIWSWDLWGRN